MLPGETVYKPTPDIECHCCDFRDLVVRPSSVAAVITDLPWKKPWVKNIHDIAEWSKRVLKPTGVLATWYGQANLEKCMTILREHGLHYGWLFIAPFYGTEPAKGRFIAARYRPALVYTVGEKLRLHRRRGRRDPWHQEGEEVASASAIARRDAVFVRGVHAGARVGGGLLLRWLDNRRGVLAHEPSLHRQREEPEALRRRSPAVRGVVSPR